MEPHNLYGGGGVAATVVSPVVLAATLLSGLLILLLPQRKAYLPFMITGILVPTNQVVVLGGLHFTMLRILALFAIARLVRAKSSGKERIFSGGKNGIDSAVLILLAFTVIDAALLWQSEAEIVYQIGSLIDAAGAYLLARHLIRDENDIGRVLKPMAYISVLIAVTMAYEHVTGVNPFYTLLGGAYATRFSAAIDRAGFLRARGPFGHPIIAGTFGGFMVPLFVAWWHRETTERKYMAPGLLGAGAIPLLVGSSTALFALLAGLGALCLWPMRKRLWVVRWGVVAILICAQMVMKSPVWHLIEDLSITKDSSSYHRYMLVNECILHFWDWALVGTKNFASWGWDMWDLANQYVATADRFGLIPLIAFVAALVIGFRYIGKARLYFEGNQKEEFFVWAIGASLFANAVGFFGIGYWDQVIVPWYMVLAMVSAVSLPARRPSKVLVKEVKSASHPARPVAPRRMGPAQIKRGDSR
jgi:hypothetical protein